MITTNGLLETGVRGVKAFQSALATSSHNITNSQTVGYTRQRVNLDATAAFAGVPGMTGTGVEIGSIVRLRSGVLDVNIRNQNGEVSRYEQLSASLDTMQGILGDATNGQISDSLTKFFNAWQELSANPESLPSRQMVLSNAQSLTDAFRNASGRLDDLNTGLNQQFTLDINDLNSYSDQIGELNQQISLLEFQHQNANDLRDLRDTLLDKMSKLTNIHSVENANGMVDVDVGGNYLVQGITTIPVTAVTNASNHVEAWLGAVQLPVTTGKFQGYADSFASRDNMLKDLNTLAGQISTSVNAIHSTGFDLNGNPAGNFFTVTPGNEAATLDVTAAIQANAALISSSSAAGAPGGNAISLQLAQLRDVKVLPSPGATFTLHEAFNNITSSVGTQGRRAGDLHDDFSRILASSVEQRESISGVNMDEELTNMLAYQRAYEASARVVTTVDDVMDKLINHMGRVGLA